MLSSARWAVKLRTGLAARAALSIAGVEVSAWEDSRTIGGPLAGRGVVRFPHYVTGNRNHQRRGLVGNQWFRIGNHP